jgi:hypothetical protein
LFSLLEQLYENTMAVGAYACSAASAALSTPITADSDEEDDGDSEGMSEQENDDPVHPSALSFNSPSTALNEEASGRRRLKTPSFSATNVNRKKRVRENGATQLPKSLDEMNKINAHGY